MEIKLNNGLIIDSARIVDAHIDPFYNLQFEVNYAQSKELKNSRIQRRVTTHALGHEYNSCILIVLASESVIGEISEYYTEYHPDNKTAKKRIRELVYGT